MLNVFNKFFIISNKFRKINYLSIDNENQQNTDLFYYRLSVNKHE